jgi:uncharacterized protein YjbI with pentapeptide repeats
MSDKSVVLQICQQYSDGERRFPEVNLEKANLEKAFLSQIDLSNSVLDYANLEQADLSDAMLRQSSLFKANLFRANLQGADFTKADLSSANVTGATIAGANFAYANLSKANLSGVKLLEANIVNPRQDINSLAIAKANKVNFHGANLTGAFFMGVDLSSAHLEGAVYDDKTNLAPNFDPANAGMVHIRAMQTIALDKLLAQFNHLLSHSNRLLGPTITRKYFNASRPDFDWLNQFQINSSRQIAYVGTVSSFVSVEQLDYFQQWIDIFTQTCSKIIKNFPAES